MAMPALCQYETLRVRNAACGSSAFSSTMLVSAAPRVQRKRIGNRRQSVERGANNYCEDARPAAFRYPVFHRAVRNGISLLSALWPAQTEITFGAEDIAIKACDPLPPLRGNIQISNGGLDMWRNAVPIKLRV
jgi:hypothetical protein